MTVCPIARLAGLCASAVLFGWLSLGTAAAVPAFTAQTGQSCASCHVGGLGPQLTAFGRTFKMNGYTLRGGDNSLPASIMAITSYLHSKKDQPAAPARHYAVNDNTTLDQVSIFVAGGAGHFGGFTQTTYDGVGRAWSWDNADLRAIAHTQMFGGDQLLGLSLNNSPTVQDPWNSLSAWGFPYTDSALAPSPAASPAIADAFAQNVVGLTAYGWWNGSLYTEAGFYESPGGSFLHHLGVDPAGTSKIKNAAPYLRAAYEHPVGPGVLELGAFAFLPEVYPGRDTSANTADKLRDIGVDASWEQAVGEGGALTVHGRYTHEDQKLNASQALGAATNRDNTLQDLRADVSYYWPSRLGLTAGAFRTWGSSDDLLYADSRKHSPDSAGFMLQADKTFFGDGSSPLGPRFNLRIGAQIVAYTQFDGSSKNYDGAGRNASDNDSLRFFAWFAY